MKKVLTKQTPARPLQRRLFPSSLWTQSNPLKREGWHHAHVRPPGLGAWGGGGGQVIEGASFPFPPPLCVHPAPRLTLRKENKYGVKARPDFRQRDRHLFLSYSTSKCQRLFTKLNAPCREFGCKKRVTSDYSIVQG